MSLVRLIHAAGPPGMLMAALVAGACARGRAGPPAPEPVLPSAGVAEAAGIAANSATLAADRDAIARHQARVAVPTRWGEAPIGSPHPERAREIDLQHQSARLRFDRARRTVIGTTTLRLAAIGAARSVLTLDAVGIRTVRVTTSGGAALPFDQGDSALVISLPAPLAPGRVVTISVDYESRAGARGVHVGDAPAIWLDGSLGLVSRWLPTIAEPSEAATWELLVRVPQRQRVLASGRLASTRAVGNEVEFRWIQERAAPAHLLAAYVADGVVLQDRWRAASTGYWTPASHVEHSWRRLGRTPRMIELFSSLTGIDYAWPAYDQALVVDEAHAGHALPGAGMALHVTGREGGAATDAWRDDAGVARLLAHQWFDARRTPRSWTHLWLTDGLAAFMAQEFVAREHGDTAARLLRDEARERALAADVVARRPLVYDRWRADPRELRGAHSGDRGALVLQMLRRELGDSVFWRGWRSYSAAPPSRAVDSDDLRASIEASSGRRLEPFFRQWVYGAGYPILDVRAEFDSSTRRLRIVVRQVQPRDSLTGLFMADAELRVVTALDTVTVPVPIRGETTEVSHLLPGAPRTLRFDPDGWLLARTRFHRPNDQLRALLLDRDPLARLDGLRALDAAGDTGAVPAISALLDRDREERVRASAAAALGSLRALLRATGRDTALAALRRSASSDTRPVVRAAALEAAARSLTDVADSGARGEVVAMAVAWLADSATEEVQRLAAVRSLGRFAPEWRRLLPALGDARADVRQAAASVVARQGISSDVPALAARLEVEQDPLVRNALEEAVAVLEGR